MRAMPFGLFLVATLITATSVTALAGDAKLVLHMEPWELETDHPPCLDESASTLACEDVVVEGSGADLQKLFLYVTGVNSVSSVSFDMQCPYGGFGRWEVCSGDVHWDTFPESWCFGTTAFTWDPPLVTESPDELVLLAYFRVVAPTPTTIGFSHDPNRPPIIHTGSEWLVLGSEDFGRVDTGGTGGGYNPCAMPTPRTTTSWSVIKATFD